MGTGDYQALLALLYRRSDSYSEECGQDTADGGSNFCSISFKPSLWFGFSLRFGIDLRIARLNSILLSRLRRHNEWQLSGIAGAARQWSLGARVLNAVAIRLKAKDSP